MQPNKLAKPSRKPAKDRVISIRDPDHLADILSKLGERLLIVSFVSVRFSKLEGFGE